MFAEVHESQTCTATATIACKSFAVPANFCLYVQLITNERNIHESKEANTPNNTVVSDDTFNHITYIEKSTFSDENHID